MEHEYEESIYITANQAHPDRLLCESIESRIRNFSEMNGKDDRKRSSSFSSTTDENGYEIPITFRQPIYIDLEPPTCSSAPATPQNNRKAVNRSKTFASARKKKNLKSNNSFNDTASAFESVVHLEILPNQSSLAKQIMQTNKKKIKDYIQGRRLPESPAFGPSSLPEKTDGFCERRESCIYEEIDALKVVPPFDKSSEDDHDYVEIVDEDEKVLLQSIKQQGRTKKLSECVKDEGKEDVWNKVAVPGVLRAKQ